MLWPGHPVSISEEKLDGKAQAIVAGIVMAGYSKSEQPNSVGIHINCNENLKCRLEPIHPAHYEESLD